MHWFLFVLKKYASFAGRARRTEYWMYSLFNLIFVSVAIMGDNLFQIAPEGIGFGPLYGLYTLAIAIPSIAVSVRRLHDTGRSGLQVLLGLIPVFGQIWFLVMMVKDSDPNENVYGPNPKIAQAELIEERTGDWAVVIAILWIFFAYFFNQIIVEINPDYYLSSWFNSFQIISSFIWSLVPILVAMSIRNKTMQIVMFAFGGIYLMYGWYETIMTAVNNQIGF